MNALLILFGGNLTDKAFQPVFDGKNSVALCVEQGKKFPDVKKVVLLAYGEDFSFLDDDVQIERKNSSRPWTKRGLLEKISSLQAGFDCVYFAFADCPFLDPSLAGKIARRHLEQRAEYSYADGFPYGLAPEIISPGTAGILAKILGEADDGAVQRDILFSCLQKDINAFNIEAEISAVDLRCHRINLCADLKRNVLMLKNFLSANGGKIPSAEDTEKIIASQPEILRTLPAFFPVQVYGGCPQRCSICPYPIFTNASERKDFMEAEKFEALLDKIILFSGDAVIDLSLWGELSLHPQKMKLIEAVLARKELALVIETSALGWKDEELEKTKSLCDELAKKGIVRKNPLPPLSWIVSLDAQTNERYAQLREHGFTEAQGTAKKLLSLFPNDCYVQSVRLKDEEQDTEIFYRYWKENAPLKEKNIIIQKYDDFCGELERRQASDISPVIRKPCRHIMRDMPVLIDGTVPLCREDLSVLKERQPTALPLKSVLGNVFADSLEDIWQNGQKYYIEQCKENYSGICKSCDEYYTYNF